MLTCCSAAVQQLLLSARPLAAAPSQPRRAACAHPTAPAPLRRVATFDEACVELLLVASTAASASGNTYQCCPLPRTFPQSQVGGRVGGWVGGGLAGWHQGRSPPPWSVAERTTAPRHAALQSLARLISLSSLRPDCLVDSLAAVEGHLTNTRAQRPRGAPPSSLCRCPEFACYLERCLELARDNKVLGPAPYVLLLQVRCAGAGRGGRTTPALCVPPTAAPASLTLLVPLPTPPTPTHTPLMTNQIVSRLGYGEDEELRGAAARFLLHLQVGLEEAVELHTEVVTPQVGAAKQPFVVFLRTHPPPIQSIRPPPRPPSPPPYPTPPPPCRWPWRCTRPGR